MMSDEMRMKLWCDVYVVGLDRSELEPVACVNRAMLEFDKRFPAESSEPVDKPRRMWLTFQAGCLDGRAWNSERSAKQIIEDYADTCYAEFQQVGPMVRRDDENK